MYISPLQIRLGACTDFPAGTLVVLTRQLVIHFFILPGADASFFFHHEVGEIPRSACQATSPGQSPVFI
jgi:hypothetical protein